MAITKVSQYNSSPTAVADYQAQNNYLQALINQANGSVGILTQADVSTIPSISQGSYISMGGTLYIVDTEDYTILGSVVSGNNYIAVAVSGVNLTATWVQDISSYSWNSVYNYYSDGTNILLPYIVSYDISYYIGTFQQSFKANQELLINSDVKHNSLTANTLLANTTNTTKLNLNGSDMYLVPKKNTIDDVVLSTTSGFDVNSINGLAYNEDYIIACEDTNNVIGLIDIDIDAGTASVVSYFSSPGTHPSGLTFDGTNLISCDSDTDLIYVHDGTSDVILYSFASPGGSISDLAFDGTNLISSDTTSDLIYVHDGISSSILYSFTSPDSDTTALAFDGSNLVIGSYTNERIHIMRGVSDERLSYWDVIYKVEATTFMGTYFIYTGNASNSLFISSERELIIK